VVKFGEVLLALFQV